MSSGKVQWIDIAKKCALAYSKRLGIKMPRILPDTIKGRWLAMAYPKHNVIVISKPWFDVFFSKDTKKKKKAIKILKNTIAHELIHIKYEHTTSTHFNEMMAEIEADRLAGVTLEESHRYIKELCPEEYKYLIE